MKMMINNKMETKTVVKSNKLELNYFRRFYLFLLQFVSPKGRSDILKILNITRTRRSCDILCIVHSTKLKKDADSVIFRRFANIFRRLSKGHTVKTSSCTSKDHRDPK